ncbi:protein D2-like [Amphiura filiformis]|uniref:protein D2-like n=1 Tax=Amphiura filiformis TaxID=82378 RepID=UPI003B2167D4
MKLGLLCGLLFIALGDGSGSSCQMDMYTHSKDLCDSFKEKKSLQLKYSTGDEVSCGDKIELAVSDEEPVLVRYQGEEKAKYYTLLMVDPDAPSAESPSSRYWLHWLVTNIDGEDLLHSESETIAGYHKPSPPPGTGVHRYQFFLFGHNDKLEVSNPVNERGCFCVIGFVERYHLGDPVAATQFLTKND